MADAFGRRDPIAERVISVMSRQDGAAHMRKLLRSLTPSDAQVVAARYVGIPAADLAAGLGVSVRGIGQIERRVVAELSSQPSIFTDTDALQSLEYFAEEKVTGVLEEFLLDESLPTTAFIKNYMLQREHRCKVCRRPMPRLPVVVDASKPATRKWEMSHENGRPREYCSDRCRQRAYRDRKRANRGDQSHSGG